MSYEFQVRRSLTIWNACTVQKSGCRLELVLLYGFFFFSSRRRHTRFDCDWSSDVCSSDLVLDRRTERVEVFLATPPVPVHELAVLDGSQHRAQVVSQRRVPRVPAHRRAARAPLLERVHGTG